VDTLLKSLEGVSDDADTPEDENEEEDAATVAAAEEEEEEKEEDMALELIDRGVALDGVAKAPTPPVAAAGLMRISLLLLLVLRDNCPAAAPSCAWLAGPAL
jgi:hypothetical protein